MANHGTGGPLYVSDQIYLTGLGHAMISGLNELGVPKADLNDLNQCTGAMFTQHTSYLGKRWSSQDALFKGIGITARLSLATNTKVNKVTYL